MIYIVTSRFNNNTWKENIEYRKKNNIEGCIYCSPQQLSTKIFPNAPIFVVEMNNTTNKILGIGLIVNKIQFDKYYKVYEMGNYNRYTYRSTYRLDRQQLLDYFPSLVNILDHILFKEKTHMKRGGGMTQIPEKLLRHPKCKEIDVVKEIKLLFVKHFIKNEELQDSFILKPSYSI
jgi:hypothetical protein